MVEKLSKNFIALILGEGVSHLIGFLINAYIARILNVEGFGIVNYSLAFLAYLLLFNNMGLTTLGAREISRNLNDKRIIGEITGARFILTLFLLVIFLVLILILPGNPLTKKVIICYIMTGIPSAFYLEFVFQARGEMEFVAGGKIIQYLSYAFFILMFLKNKNQLLTVPLSYLAGYTIATFFLIIFFTKRYDKIYLNLSNFYKQLKIAFPIGFATIIYQSVLNFPTICLGIFHSQTEVGFFSASFKIIIFLLLVERIIYYIFFPILSRQAKQPNEILKRNFILFSQIVLGVTLLIALPCMILANKIITFIYGSNFYNATITFRILLLYFIIAPLNTIWGYGLVALNQEKKFLKVITITALINLILTIILGYTFRGIGIGIAIFIAEFCGLILMKKNLNSVINFSIFKIIR